MTDAVAAVDPGDHACLTFTETEERLDLVAAFVRDGLRAGWKVVCWTDALPPDELAGQLTARSVRPVAALRRRQLRIAPAAAKAHSKTVAAQVYHEHPLLRVCRQYSPPGVRIAGSSTTGTATCWTRRWPSRSAWIDTCM